MKKVKYIGLDISTSIIGVCFLDNNNDLIELESINLKKIKCIFEKSKMTKLAFENYLNKYTLEENVTIFIEEALHRLGEIHYYLGLEKEAKKYASILGYNYNSGKWFEESYKLLNKDYEVIKKKAPNKKENIFKKIINKIK